MSKKIRKTDIDKCERVIIFLLWIRIQNQEPVGYNLINQICFTIFGYHAR